MIPEKILATGKRDRTCQCRPYDQDFIQCFGKFMLSFPCCQTTRLFGHKPFHDVRVFFNKLQQKESTLANLFGSWRFSELQTNKKWHSQSMLWLKKYPPKKTCYNICSENWWLEDVGRWFFSFQKLYLWGFILSADLCDLLADLGFSFKLRGNDVGALGKVTRKWRKTDGKPQGCFWRGFWVKGKRKWKKCEGGTGGVLLFCLLISFFFVLFSLFRSFVLWFLLVCLHVKKAKSHAN